MRLRLVIESAAAVAASMSVSCAAVLAPSAPMSTPEGVRFVLLQPDASTVALAGTFNHWSITTHPLSQDPSSGAWAALVPLSPGEHLFMYVVNGTKWLSPPAAEDYVDDGFGARNGVVVVR